MTNEELRIVAASLMRELGHEFVGRTLSDEQLITVSEELRSLLGTVTDAPARVRVMSRASLEDFTMTIPTYDEIGERLLAPRSARPTLMWCGGAVVA